ncbi:CapA family protein [Clostridium sp. B9]|uniref:CapA family protein n=1 Tax=Clostridium sp. B9 TaxID=3423224 RepID=UPI003D2EE8D5
MVKMSNTIKILLGSLAVVCSTVIANSLINNNIVTTSGANIKENNEEIKKEKKSFFDRFSFGREIKISAVGDIIVHDEQIWSAYNDEDKTYNFTPNFKYIKSFIEESDISYGTIEGTYSGKEKQYSGYPKYNAPDSMLDALSDSGFDIINIATDHTLDNGEEGLNRTIDKVNENMSATGNKGYIIKELKGMKIGFTSYTYESREGELNENKIGENANVNTFSYNTLEEDLEKMNESIKKMKEDGVDFIIFGMHWGASYSSEPSEYQIGIANKLNELGVDLIIGSNPHVVQPIEEIVNEDGHKTLVAYSLGNFISNQREETMGDRRTADGVILNVTLDKGRKGVEIEEWSYTPTWVYKIPIENKKSEYFILPIEKTLASEEGKALDTSVINELNKSLESTNKIIGAVKK